MTTTVTKNALLDSYKKLRRDCKKDLKAIEKGTREYEIIEGNMHKAEQWIKFLTDPDVPELGDPQFKAKMKKLEAKDKKASKKK